MACRAVRHHDGILQDLPYAPGWKMNADIKRLKPKMLDSIAVYGFPLQWLCLFRSFLGQALNPKPLNPKPFLDKPRMSNLGSGSGVAELRVGMRKFIPWVGSWDI